ncbi:MAG: hypothetical protein GY803_28780 [Chloroflexi bacterium]|nr:hypothetical protein [Chloroflexota bacterium]
MERTVWLRLACWDWLSNFRSWGNGRSHFGGNGRFFLYTDAHYIGRERRLLRVCTPEALTR